MEDDSGCESDVSSNDSGEEVLNNHPRRKRKKKYGYDQNDDNIALRYKVTHNSHIQQSHIQIFQDFTLIILEMNTN